MLRRTIPVALATATLAAAIGFTSGAVADAVPSAAVPAAVRTAATGHGTTRATRQTPLQAAIRPKKLYFGVSAPSLPYTSTSVVSFAKAAKKRPNLVQWYQSFSDSFNPAQLRGFAAGGQLPMVTWEPFNYLQKHTNPYPLKAIASGRFDTYLRAQAVLVKSVGAPVAIRLAPEMNGDWFAWGQHTHGNTPAQFVAMWRHVHDVFAAAGASNVIWVWSPNVVTARPKVPLASLYPGNAYVNMVGIDGYLRNNTPTHGFGPIFGSTFSQLNHFAKTKPIILAETGVTPGKTQVALFRSLITGVLKTPRVIGFVWFDYKQTVNWLLEGHPALIKVFRQLIANPRFGGLKR